MTREPNPVGRLAAIVVVVVVVALAVAACGGHEGGSEQGAEAAGEHASESREHDEGESGEHDGGESGEGEESGAQFAPDETYDEVRAGARLILAYDSKANQFRGTVENTTNNVLTQTRVEVHLSNGVELGPTTPIDLEPGQIADVTLTATDASFETWSAHPEVG